MYILNKDNARINIDYFDSVKEYLWNLWGVEPIPEQPFSLPLGVVDAAYKYCFEKGYILNTYHTV